MRFLPAWTSVAEARGAALATGSKSGAHGRDRLHRLLTGLLLGWGCAALAAANPPATQGDLPVLSHAAEVRNLTPEEAAKGYPVDLRVVVTYHNHPKNLFVQDATSGMGVLEDVTQADGLEPGQLIELRGVTAAGEFARTVYLRQVRVLRTVGLPDPQKVTFEEMASGSVDSQWLELRGIVRSTRVNLGTGLPEMTIAAGGGFVRVEVKAEPGSFFPRLVDSVVRVRGAVGGIYNQTRQLVAVKLFVPGVSNIVVDVLSPADPFAAPARPISTLLQFSPQRAYGHRVKVCGTVTFCEPGRRLFIRDATQGLSVQAAQPETLKPGDRIEVVGFPALGEWMPLLQDATFRIVGSGPAPEPAPVNVSQALEGQFDTDLVAIKARLLETVRRPGAVVLVMQTGGLIFNAVLEVVDAAVAVPRKDSELRLSGICLVQVGGPAKRREAFQILLRSPQDIVVLRNPPWWTVARVRWVLGITTLVLMLAIGWGLALNRRVGTQTEIIRRNVQREAILEERTRIAREFHDTLEQELAGITMQLDCVAAKLGQAGQTALRDLALARRMMRRAMGEAHRSVWDLRCHALERATLRDAIAETARPLAAGTNVQVRVQERGRSRRLAGLVETHLLRISQEAVANAVKHARARHVEIQVQYDVDRVWLRIRDDGRGFDSTAPPAADEGHFGLLGMRERAEKMHGRLELRSKPGAGTQIIVEAPTVPGPVPRPKQDCVAT